MTSKTYKAFGAAPFVRTRMTTGDLMYLVVLALLPCAGIGIYHYGFHAALLIGISVSTAIVFELICNWIWRSRASSVMDYSCVVTGLIGGLILPPAAPYWAAAALSAMAIFLFKHAFGGLGRNLLNPAMAAKCVLLVTCRDMMTDLTTGQYTALAPIEMLQGGETPRLSDMLTGNVTGCIGTSSAIAVLAAAVILFLAGMIDLTIPLAAMVGFSVCYVFIGRYGMSSYTLAIQLCGGSFLFTCFIMAEDYTTSPISRPARIWYGVLLGCGTFVMRKLGLYEDGVAYALLLVNFLRPLLDRKLAPKPFGATASKWVIREARDRRQRNTGSGVSRNETTVRRRRPAEAAEGEADRLTRQAEQTAAPPEQEYQETVPAGGGTTTSVLAEHTEQIKPAERTARSKKAGGTERNKKPEGTEHIEQKERTEQAERTNEAIDEEFRRFQELIEKEARGLETARYTGNDSLLREAYAEAEAEQEKHAGALAGEEKQKP